MQQHVIVPTIEAGDLTAARAGLAHGIARWTEDTEQFCTAIPGLILYRVEAPTEPLRHMHEASVCLIAQGAKRMLLGEDVYIYDTNHFLLTSVGLPVMLQVIEASREKPYLGLKLNLDQREIAQMMLDGNLPLPRSQKASRGMAVGRASAPLFNAFLRLIDLLDKPEDIPILAPLVQKEILYRLLVGDQGWRLREIASAGSHSHQIAEAIQWLQGNFTQSVRIDDLASNARMSTSTFHQHFRLMTAMSPLQYQKWLRLHEARRLMLTERLDAATAGFQVGYESASQFNREYRRLFGAPPLQDIRNLQQMATGERA